MILPREISTAIRPWLLVVALALIGVRTGSSQQRRPQTIPDSLPWGDPEKFLEFLLGEETPAEREAIERIPVTVREERQCGNRAADAFLDDLRRQGIDVRSKGRDVDYVRRLMTLIHRQMRNKGRYRSFRVLVADSDQTDAVAFPGGTVMISRGLIDLCGSEAALVGVLGHELSHLDHGHQLHMVRRMKRAQQTFSPRGAASPEQWLSDGMLLLKGFLRPFRPEDEAAADADGATWAYRAGYDPREMAKLFQRMAGRGGETAGLPAFLRSHPYHADRFRATQELYTRLQAAKPTDKLYVGRENLRRRITRAEREFADR